MHILLLVVAILLLSVRGVLVFADYRWRAKTTAVIVRLHSGSIVSPSAVFSAAAIEGLVHDRARIEALRANVLAARTRLNWDQEAKGLIAVYRDLADSMSPNQSSFSARPRESGE